MTTLADRLAPARPGLPAGLLREARPKQWVKNLLAFAAPGAAGVLFHADVAWRSLLLFAALCAAASGTYFLNDVVDVEADRRHPVKRNRPVAAGVVPVRLARWCGALLLVLGVGLAAATGRWAALGVVAAYIALTLAYTGWLKHIAVVDLVAIASGFVLRAIAGAAAVDVPMSDWFLICTSCGSLFIVTGKRYAELNHLGDRAGSVRATLDAYNVAFLRLVLGVACATTLLSYCVWAFDKAHLATTSWPWYQLSIVPMATALLRYALVLEAGHGSAPEDVFAEDRALQVLVVVWLVVFGLGVYAG